MHLRRYLICFPALFGSLSAQAGFDPQLGYAYNKTQGRVIQRDCMSINTADIRYLPPNQGIMKFASNLNESQLSRALGLNLEGQYNGGGFTASGQFSFVNSAAKTDYSQTLSLIYTESGAIALIPSDVPSQLSSLGEQSLALTVDEQAERCGHAHIRSIEYGSGLLVNLRTSFSVKLDEQDIAGLIKVESEYSVEGEFKRYFSSLKEVGRFHLDVYGWGRYSDLVTNVLAPLNCEGTACKGTSIFELQPDFCKQQPDVCRSTDNLRQKIQSSILACNTSNNADACFRAMDSIYAIAKDARVSGTDLDQAFLKAYTKTATPISIGLKSYLGSLKSDGSIVDSWFPRALSDAEISLINSYKSLMQSDIQRYSREVRDLGNLTSLSYVMVEARRQAAYQISSLNAAIQYLQQGIDACQSLRVTTESCEKAREDAYSKITKLAMRSDLGTLFARSKPIDVLCEEYLAYALLKKELEKAPNFIMSPVDYESLGYFLNFGYQKTSAATTAVTVETLANNFANNLEPNLVSKTSDSKPQFSCKAIATEFQKIRRLELDGDKLQSFRPVFSQPQVENLIMKDARTKIGEITASSFPQMRELKFTSNASQNYNEIKNHKFLAILDLEGTRATNLSTLNGSPSLRCLKLRKAKIASLNLNDLFNLEVIDLRNDPEFFLPMDFKEFIMSDDLPYLSKIYVRKLKKPDEEGGRIDDSIDCDSHSKFTTPGGFDRQIICLDVNYVDAHNKELDPCAQ